MTASAANDFGQIAYAPTGTSCNEIPYDFHPMYSTSSPQTRVIWAAHTYNIAFSDELGQFDWCSSVNTANFGCNGLEGPPGDQEPTETGNATDDFGCLPGSLSLLYPASGCTGQNTPGFDGASYQRD